MFLFVRLNSQSQGALPVGIQRRMVSVVPAVLWSARRCRRSLCRRRKVLPQAMKLPYVLVVTFDSLIVSVPDSWPHVRSDPSEVSRRARFASSYTASGDLA